ncbi:uncharacterized protein LOC143258781 [Megalopta genalis]|uniref:uncharacterized protein LOC143258781 n=1 Tax=Megalopta genalis TaxID=115081 RepID=UPI003FD2E807
MGPSNMKSKSVSVQNLESLVKQVVNEALEDNEQVIKFRRMIYEEWYFKKRSEQTDTNREGDEDISGTVVHRRSNRKKYKRATVLSSAKLLQEADPPNECEELHENVSFSKRVDQKDVVSTDENVIEIWRKPLKRPQTKNDSRNPVKNTEEIRNPNRLSFEDWTTKKTLAYRDILKRMQCEQRLRRVSVSRANAERGRKQMLLSRQMQNRKRQRRKQATESHLSYTKKEEDAKFDAGETRTQKARKGMRTSIPRKVRPASMKIMEAFVVSKWLNQLNSILSQRSLGERRHLAQTFYC